MATNTTNLNLTKYDYSDVADIAPMNNNMDIIDREVSNKSNIGHKHKMIDIEGLSLEAENVTIKDAYNLFDSPNVEGALKELFQNVSNGKSSIAQAITAKGVPASASDSFATLANKISQIISALLNIPFPNFDIGIGTVDATFDTLESTFKEFRIQGQSWQSSNVFRKLEGNTNYVFEAKYGGNRVSTLSLVTPKANQAKPNSPIASNIDGDSITVTAQAGCMIRFNGNNFNSPHTFTNLNINTVYEFYSFIPGTDKLNESPLSDVLRVQTLDKLYLFKNGTKLLSDKAKWKKYRGTKTAIWDIANTIKLDTRVDSPASEIGLITLSKIDTSKFSRLEVKVSNLTRTGLDNEQDGGLLTCNATGEMINIYNPNTYSLNVANINSTELTVYVEAFTNKRTVMEISEIYLTN